MCGLCNLFNCNRRNRSCGTECNYYASRREPRMNVYCASGIGTESDAPCGCNRRQNCGCRRNNDCGCNYGRNYDCHNNNCDCD